MKMFTNNPYIKLFRLYRRFVPDRKLAILMLSFHLIARLVALLAPYFVAQIINAIQKGGPNIRENILTNIVLLTLVPLFERVFHGNARVRENKLKFKTEKAYKLHLFQSVTSFGVAWHNDHHSGETIDKIDKATAGLKEFSGNLFMYLGTFVTLIGCIVALVLIWPLAGVILPIVGALIFFLIRLFDIRIVELIKLQNKKSHKVSSLLYDYLSNIKTIITLRFVEKTWGVMDKRIESMYPYYRKRSVINERKWFTTNMILAIVIAIMIGRYSYSQLLLTGTILIGSVVMILQYMQEASSTFYNFAWQYSGIVQFNADTMAVDDILEEYKNLPPSYSLPPLQDRKTIAISNLYFTYKDSHKRTHTLSDVDMSIAAGEKIAVVGESGSGKSTFLSLLRGLYDVDSVTVKINNTEYDHLHILSHNASLIPQEPEIFEDSMRYNIAVGLDADDDTVEKFSRMACFHDVALSLPHEYETSIKEKGVNLSGGQKQRLALARGLLVSHDSDILLLDESTSSVDSINEKKIYQNIFRAYPEKTIIAAIHKLHLLPMFEVIYVFEDGKIIESGTFEGLIAHGGKFAHMRSEYSEHMNEENL